MHFSILGYRDTIETLRGVAKLCYYVSNSEQTTVSGVLHHDRRGSRRRTVIVFKQFGVRMRKNHLENMARIQGGPFGWGQPFVDILVAL